MVYIFAIRRHTKQQKRIINQPFNATSQTYPTNHQNAVHRAIQKGMGSMQCRKVILLCAYNRQEPLKTLQNMQTVTAAAHIQGRAKIVVISIKWRNATQHLCRSKAVSILCYHSLCFKCMQTDLTLTACHTDSVLCTLHYFYL